MVIDLPVVDRAPAGADVHAVVGDVDARRLAGHLPAALAQARTLLVNEPEALMLTGLDDVESAARALAGHGPTAVVTLAAGGALCAGEHGLVRAPAPEVTVVDTNGAGDLFTAAWVWADLAGAPPEERLRWRSPTPRCRCGWPPLVTELSPWTRFRREAQLLDAIIPPKGARR